MPYGENIGIGGTQKPHTHHCRIALAAYLTDDTFSAKGSTPDEWNDITFSDSAGLYSLRVSAAHDIVITLSGAAAVSESNRQKHEHTGYHQSEHAIASLYMVSFYCFVIKACVRRPGAAASVERRRRERRTLLAGAAGELAGATRARQARPSSACTFSASNTG
jgi:hypothetical protein